MTSETDLILPRIAAGDQSAVEECLNRFGGLVWSLARRMCRDLHEAEDAVQDVFVEVWKNASRYDDSIASEATFIAMIARRRLIDRRRRADRRPNPSALSDGGVADPEMDAEIEPQLGEDVVKAREVITKLSEDQQMVLQLSIFYGMSHEKISTSTGMPLGTVKTHARRGLIKVRQLLDTSENGNGANSDQSGGASAGDQPTGSASGKGGDA